MDDGTDKTAEQLATEINSPQNEQASAADNVDYSPASVPATREELILGKFQSTDDLATAYQELERKYTTSRQSRVEPPVREPEALPETIFDDQVTHGIRSIFQKELNQELENRKAIDFARKYEKELSDPLLRGAVYVEIQEAKARNEYIDQEVALANAKAALEARLIPKVEAAVKESTAEDKDLARRKEKAGAIGGTNVATPEVDPETLSASEYAAYYGL